MKRGFLILVLSAILSHVNAFALSVSTSGAGELGGLVSDRNVTELIVSGLIDVRDIKFIAEEMSALETLDLSDTQIMAYSSNIPCIGDVLEYEENMLPAYSFFDKDYKVVKLPSLLERIGESAFAGCDMLTSIIFPLGLTSIEDYAFSSCLALKSIEIPHSVKNIGKGVFSHCTALTEVNLSKPEGDCVFGKNMFAGCTALEKVVLSNNMTNIPDGAFAGCTALKSVAVGEFSKLEGIGVGAFCSTGLTSFTFESCANVKSIGDYAFANAMLEEIHIPKSVNNLGEGAFFYNPSLRSAVLPLDLSELKAFVFSGAMSLNSVILGGNMASIGRYAFESNDSMTEMKVYAVTVPELGENVFDRVNQSSVVLTVPEKSAELYKSADQWKEFNVVGGMSSIGESVETNDCIKIYFSGDKLYVSAIENIAIVEVYEPGGMTLVTSRSCAETATIDLYNTDSKIYIVTVQLENGKQKTVKLVK